MTLATDDRTLVGVVVAGGTGTRLYPASRSDRPKQFTSLAGEDTLLERTVDRLAGCDRRFVLTAPEYADRVRDLVPEAGLLIEPEPRDTGPALAYATARVRDLVADPVCLFVPADHHVDGDFGAAAGRATRGAVTTGGLVTMGVEPTRPATEYGYLDPTGDPAAGDVVPVERFREKPDAETAADLVAAGALWNAGVFAWTPEAFLDAARGTPLDPIVAAAEAGDPAAGFPDVPTTSVDYAVMERADAVYTLPVAFEWDDLGSWDALSRVLGSDDDGTVHVGETLGIDATDSVLVGVDGHVTAIGVDGIAVVSWGDRTVVVPTDEAERVRAAVDRLRDAGRF